MSSLMEQIMQNSESDTFLPGKIIKHPELKKQFKKEWGKADESCAIF